VSNSACHELATPYYCCHDAETRVEPAHAKAKQRRPTKVGQPRGHHHRIAVPYKTFAPVATPSSSTIHGEREKGRYRPEDHAPSAGAAGVDSSGRKLAAHIVSLACKKKEPFYQGIRNHGVHLHGGRPQRGPGKSNCHRAALPAAFLSSLPSSPGMRTLTASRFRSPRSRWRRCSRR
jgi:hypothetical protein